MRKGNATWKKGLYRSRNGLIFGVCRGAAEYLDVSVFWLRVITVMVFLFTGLCFSPVFWLYLLGAFLMKPQPMIPFETEADREFYDSYASSRSLAIHRLKRTFDSLDRRIRRIESIVTARDFDWESRLRK